MGYTHYWRSHTDIPPDTWEAISDDVRKLAKGFEGAKVEIDAAEIVIHGSCETFALQRTAEDFGFCKTRLGAYDKLVCAALAVAAERYPGLDVSSDGFMQDDGGAWGNAINWASNTLGRNVPDPSGAEAPGPEYSRWTGEAGAEQSPALSQGGGQGQKR
jgi:hypothetical protein